MKKYQRLFCCLTTILSLVACSKKVDITAYNHLTETQYTLQRDLPNYTHFWKDLNLFFSQEDDEQVAALKANMRQKIAETMNYTDKDKYPIAYNGIPYSDDLMMPMTSTEPFNTGQLNGALDNYKVEAVVFNTLASVKDHQLVMDNDKSAHIGEANHLTSLTTMTIYLRNMTNKPIIFNGKNSLFSVSLGDYRLSYLSEVYDKTHYILPNGYFHLTYLLVPQRLFMDKYAWVGHVDGQTFEVTPNEVLNLYQEYNDKDPLELQQQLIQDHDFLNLFHQPQLQLTIKNGKYIFNTQLQRKEITNTKLYQYLGDNHD